MPLLAEHYFGEGRDIDSEFGLVALRKQLAGAMAAVIEPGLSDDETEGASPP